MSERSLANTVLNPYEIKHPVLKGAGLALVTGYTAGIITSGFLHRSTHGGVEYSKSATRLWRAANLALTGMPKFDWTDHLAHHEFPDKYDQEAHQSWNSSRKEGMPEAPVEAFRDPYSVVLEGYKKVLFNTSGLHRKAKKGIVPFLHALNNFDEQNNITTRDHWPKHFQRVDMEEGDPAAFRNKYAYAGLVAIGGFLALKKGPAYSLGWTGTHLTLLLGMGGFINGVAHTGQEPGLVNRLKVMAGSKDPVADETGQYGSDILPGNEGFLVGEPHHNYHHANPADPYLAGDTLRRDPVGKIIKWLEKLRLAKTPGAKTAN